MVQGHRFRRLAIALAVGLTACGAGTGGASDELVMDDLEMATAEGVRRDLIIEVENQNFHNATLYAVTREGGHRQRLGSVGSYNTETFTFRWPSASELRIEIDLLASGKYLTQPLLVQEGDELRLVIEPDLHRRRPGVIP